MGVVFYGMTSRRPKTIPLPDAIAENVRHCRDDLGLTQTELAANMNNAGFITWSRTTVAEIEGGGRGRRIGLAELLGLGVGGPIELIPGGPVMGSISDLVALVIPHDVTIQLLETHAQAGMHREVERLRRLEIERMHEVAEELRGTAGWFEDKAKSLIEIEES